MRDKESEELRASLPVSDKTAPASDAKEAEFPRVDFDSLKSLQDLGIDTSFVDHFKSKSDDEIQQKLDNAAEAVNELHDLQQQRLSEHPSSDKVKNIPDKELSAATNLSGRLAAIAKQAKPGELTDAAAVQKALGVGLINTGVQSNADRVDDIMTTNSSSPTAADPIDHHIAVGGSPTAVN